LAALGFPSDGYPVVMTDQRNPRGQQPAPPAVPQAPDETLVQQGVVREEQVIVTPDADITPGVVHEEERVGVRSDGAVVRELDRVEKPPVDQRRNWWPWAISTILLLVLIGLAIW